MVAGAAPARRCWLFPRPGRFVGRMRGDAAVRPEIAPAEEGQTRSKPEQGAASAQLKGGAKKADCKRTESGDWLWQAVEVAIWHAADAPGGQLRGRSGRGCWDCADPRRGARPAGDGRAELVNRPECDGSERKVSGGRRPSFHARKRGSGRPKERAKRASRRWPRGSGVCRAWSWCGISRPVRICPRRNR